MKKTDFRIGNYLQDTEGRLCKVEILGSDWNEEGIQALAIDGPLTSLPNSPIPLTDEWLEKFGFAEGNKRCAYLNLPGDEGEFLPFFYVNSRNSVEYVQLMDSMEENEIIRIKYVHQLQNLYFALTGEELTMKEETE